MTDSLRVEIDGPLLQVTLNRPDKLNAISDEMLEALQSAIASFSAG
jgi:enoyl-CoA hydratase/carnithine racemase